jgi:acyl carrier protein
LTPRESVALRAELLSVIAQSGASVPDDVQDEASLIRSGLLDSTALFELAVWIEERVTPGLDLTTFDLAEEWDTLGKLMRFVDRYSRER